jgi:hypothetical protein
MNSREWTEAVDSARRIASRPQEGADPDEVTALAQVVVTMAERLSALERHIEKQIGLPPFYR